MNCVVRQSDTNELILHCYQRYIWLRPGRGTNLVEDLKRLLHRNFHFALAFDVKFINQKLEMLQREKTKTDKYINRHCHLVNDVILQVMTERHGNRVYEEVSESVKPQGRIIPGSLAHGPLIRRLKGYQD